MPHQIYKNLESCEGRVRALSSSFAALLGITVFAYGRIYNDARVSWVTSNAEQDHFLLEFPEALTSEPTFGTKNEVPEGAHLWFCDRTFSGSELFYKERAKRFQMDHGMVLVRHQKDYLETCYFSGLLSKKPLYNLFANEQVLFYAFMDHFVSRLDSNIMSVLHEAVPMHEFTDCQAQKPLQIDRESALAACGCKQLLCLSERERECLLLFREGYTYQTIGKALHLSARTVEHYIESIKGKLGLETRPELYKAAKKLSTLSRHF